MLKQRGWVPAVTLWLGLGWVSAAPAGENVGASVSLWRGESLIATVGEPAAALPQGSPGDTVDVAVVIEGARSMRGAELYLAYEPEGLTFVDWKRSDTLREAVEIGPFDRPLRRVIYVATSTPRAQAAPAGGRWEVGRARFRLQDAGKARLGIYYAALLDASFKTDEWGSKPASDKQQPPQPVVHANRISGDVWWSDAYPNPFHRFTRVSFYAPDSLWFSITVLDQQGRVVRPLVNDRYQGKYHTTWEGTDFGGQRVPYGDYTLVMKAGEFPEQRQVVRYVAKSDSAAAPAADLQPSGEAHPEPAPEEKPAGGEKR